MQILTRPALERGRPPRLRLGVALVVSSVSALLLMSGVATAATHHRKRALPVVAGSRYLALGDSVTFGYEEAQVSPAPDYSDAASFIGYPEMLASELHLKVTNAACPGETTSSMVNSAAQSNGCESSPGQPAVGYRLAHPLHVNYTGSQLAFAVSYLRSHRNVRLVSLMIGANDGLMCLETTKDGCSSQAELDAVVQTVTQNLHRILRAIRHHAHYQGQLVVVNYYSPVAAYDTRTVLLNDAIDAAARPFHVAVADGFGAFALADSHSAGNPCTAGLLTQLGKPGACGIHPSYAGQAILASAIEQVIRL